MVRQGAIDSPPKTPFILGFECSGEVEEIGEGVEDFKVSVTHLASNVRSSLTNDVIGCFKTATKITACCGKTTKSARVSLATSVCMMCDHTPVTDGYVPRL